MDSGYDCTVYRLYIAELPKPIVPIHTSTILWSPNRVRDRTRKTCLVINQLACSSVEKNNKMTTTSDPSLSIRGVSR